MDENRYLKQTNEKLEADLQASQDRQLSQQLSQVSVDNNVRHQLFDVSVNGAVKRFSNSMMTLGLILLTFCNTSGRCIPNVIGTILIACGISPTTVPTWYSFCRWRYMLRTLNRMAILQFLSSASEICLGFDETDLSTGLEI